MIRAVLVIVGALLLTACASPEATRVRAGGPGADVGNHRGALLMHEGSDPYWRTPRLIGTASPSLEPARQADRLSR